MKPSTYSEVRRGAAASASAFVKCDFVLLRTGPADGNGS